MRAPKCQTIPHAADNNEETIPVNVPAVGGLVAGKCAAHGDFGALRDCDFHHESALTAAPTTPPAARKCDPAAGPVRLTCTTKSAKPQVVRICEASSHPEIAGGMDCMYIDALRTNPGTDGQGQPSSAVVTVDKPATLSFTCPASRDHEAGGNYAVYTGAFLAGAPADGVTCVAQ